MNYPPPPPGYVTPQGGPPSRTPRLVGPIILGVFVLFVVALVWGGISLFHSTTKTSAVAIGVGNRFLGLMQRHDFTDAHVLMTLDAQNATSVASMKVIQSTVEKLHGKVLSWDSPQWFVQSFNGVNSVRLTYALHSAKGSSDVTLVLQDTGGGKYAVQNYSYQL